MIITYGRPAAIASERRKNISVIQRCSNSASGRTVIRKSGLRCRVISLRRMARTFATARWSRNGTKAAGENVNGAGRRGFMGKR